MRPGPDMRRRPWRRAFARLLPPGAVVALAVGAGAYRWGDGRALEDATLAGAGVVFASVLAAVGWAMADPRVHGPRRLAELTGLTVLAVIPRGAPEGAEGSAVDVERLRSAVSGATADASPRVVAVTGPAPGEGVSAVARALAEAFARHGARTLLVDGNLRRPTLHHEYLLSRARGGTLQDHLDAQAERSVTTADGVPLSVPRVRLGPAGEGPTLWVMPALQAPAEAVPSSLAGLVACVPRWGRDFDVLVLDTPPLAEAPDALALVPHATGTLLVSGLHRAALRRVRVALDALHRAGARVIGAVATAPHPRRGIQRVVSEPAPPVRRRRTRGQDRPSRP